MLGLQVTAQIYLKVKIIVVFLKFFNGVGIGYVPEFGIDNMIEPFDKALINKTVEEIHFLGSVFEHISDNIFQHILGKFHIVLQIGEGNFGLYHPELCRMACGV